MYEDKIVEVKKYLSSLLPSAVYNMLFERLEALDAELQNEIIECLFVLFFRRTRTCTYYFNTPIGKQIDEIFDLLDGWITYTRFDGVLQHVFVKGNEE